MYIYCGYSIEVNDVGRGKEVDKVWIFKKFINLVDEVEYYLNKMMSLIVK